MDRTSYQNYLALLEDLKENLAQLSQLARDKTTAVRSDDLIALDDILKQEQAMALTLRGLEQKRLQALKELGLEDMKLYQLQQHYPQELRLQAKQTAEALQNQYDIYRSAAEVARNTLEVNLHEIEKLIDQANGSPAAGPGYSSADAEIPKNMKTDFRA